MREKVYKTTIVLTAIFVADAVFMAWALYEGGYAPLGYGQLSYVPVFIPALLLSIILGAVYLYGAIRMSWKMRGPERVFLAVITFAIAAKVVLAVRGW